MPPSSDGKIVVGFKAQERAVRIAGERRQFCNRRFLGGKVSQETLAICGPVAIFPIPISDVLGTTQHRQVNVFEAGLMERRSQRGFENPACGKRHFANIDDGFNVVVRKQGHEPGEVDAFIADGEDHGDVARFECYEFSCFALVVTKVRGTPQSESRQFSEPCISAQRRNPTQDTTYAETGARASFCDANLVTNHRSSNVTLQETRSSSGGAARLRATSMRPRESKAAAAGGNEDDEKSGAKAPDRDRGREQPRRPPEGRPTKRQQRQVPRSTTRNSTAASTPSARPQRPPTSQPPAQPQRQAQDCPSPPNALIKPTADRACSPLNCTDTRCCCNTLRSASITSR